jgi:hypothetical protein
VRGRVPALVTLLVTPWCAAGAGIVIAGMLTLHGPREALTYRPYPGQPCLSGACSLPAPRRAPGSLAIATPGVKLKTRHHKRAAARQPGSAVPAAPASQAAPAIHLGYRTAQRMGSHFIALITLRGPAVGHPWRLTLVFPAASIDHVLGAQWRPWAGHGAIISGRPWPWSGQHDRMVQVAIFATGTPGLPDGCTFNGAGCAFRH